MKAQYCTEHDAIFDSTHAAMMFAFRFSGQQYDPPAMSKMMQGPGTGSGKGLFGMDGTGQAGMIQAEVRELGPIKAAILAARFCLRTEPCDCRRSCCIGYKISKVWAESVSTVTAGALAVPLSGCVNNGRLRQGLVERYFGECRKLKDLADYCNVDSDTAATHSAKINKSLEKLESAAFYEVDQRLKKAGIVG